MPVRLFESTDAESASFLFRTLIVRLAFPAKLINSVLRFPRRLRNRRRVQPFKNNDNYRGRRTVEFYYATLS